jgi:MerR family transcriptional regulator, thiopeptide resistance regulator
VKIYTISRLAREFGLSRSTLLYYDRIALLPPSGRSAVGYRCYSQKEHRALKRICELRTAGFSLAEIRTALHAGGRPNAGILKRRMQETSRDIVQLKQQQRLLTAMAGRLGKNARKPANVDKTFWVELLKAAGMDEKGMARWHGEFERRAPEGHREFLLSLGLSAQETATIQKWAGTR